MLDSDDIPNPVADDAPSPDDFEAGEVYEHPGTGITDVIAVDHDGGRYCLDCANPEYVSLCKEDPRQIPFGGPVDRGSEVDCPGSSCDNCHRRIGDMTVLHYDGVCDPYSCQDMASEWHPPAMSPASYEVAVLERDDGDVKVMLREDAASYGEEGDTSWVPEAEVWQS